MNLTLEPTWPKGKVHSYKSSHPGDKVQPPPVNDVEPQPSTSEAELAVSPTKRHCTVREPETSGRIAHISRNACQICGETNNHSFWLGCGYKNNKTKKNDCSYWVHQWCVGLYYKTEVALSKVPFDCQRHGKAKRIKGQRCKQKNNM